MSQGNDTLIFLIKNTPALDEKEKAEWLSRIVFLDEKKSKKLIEILRNGQDKLDEIKKREDKLNQEYIAKLNVYKREKIREIRKKAEIISISEEKGKEKKLLEELDNS